MGGYPRWGYESTASWLEVRRDLKERGLSVGPRLAVGDGARGFWAAVVPVDPGRVPQRGWFHTMGKVLAVLPKHFQGKAKADRQAIGRAASHLEARLAFRRFVKRDAAKYAKATAKLEPDRETLLALYHFPAKHGGHLRTTHPIESTFATLRQRTTRTKNGVTRTTCLGLAFKLADEAAQSWRRITAPNKVQELLGGTRYENGVAVVASPPEAEQQPELPEEQRLAA